MNDTLFTCPSGGSYAMNPKLSGASLMQIRFPADLVLVYEVDESGRQLEDVHDGGAYYVSADSHAKWLPASETLDLRPDTESASARAKRR